MNTLEKIKNYLYKNNYNGEGLCDYLSRTGTDRRYKAQWCASRTDKTSGIIKYRGIKFYFSVIEPWSNCPDGKIEVEVFR